MKIDNQRNIYRIWLRKLIITIIFVMSIIAIVFLNILNKPDSTITKYHLVIAIAIVYIIVSLIGALRNPYYFHFHDTTDMLVIRYYPVSLFNHKKNSIEIPIQQFVKFDIKKFFFGIDEKLIVYQNYRKKVANYPPISLSALNRDDRDRLKIVLTRYAKK
jgi:hypothetical protein